MAREAEAARAAGERASEVPAVPLAPAADAVLAEHVVSDSVLPAIAAAPAREAAAAAAAPAPALSLPATPISVPVGDIRSKKAAKIARESRRLRAERAPRGRTSAPKRSLRQRLTATGTMVIVGGIFASLTLPSYASFATGDNGAGALVAQKDVSTQTLTVADGAATATVAMDAYGATSAADLVKVYRTSVRDSNLAAYLQSGALAMGDDYPYATEPSRSQGGGLSPLRYYYRECVDFVAWRLNRDSGYTSAPYKWDWSTLTPGGGNASQWKNAWQSKGWATGTTPEAGAVAWFSYNHVAYVNRVNADGTVLLEEYNWGSDHMYGQRTVAASDVALYLYHPPA